MTRQVCRKTRVPQKAGIKRGHAHHAGGLGEIPNNLVHIELWHEKHRAAAGQDDVGGHKEPVRVKDRQSVQQHIGLGKAPRLRQRLAIG